MNTVRLTSAEYEIMRLLIEDRVRYGFDMARTGKVSKGSVYVLLGRLEDKNMIHGEYRVQGEGVPRREYTATVHGLDVFKLWKRLQQLTA